jgi:glycosyltransferase involved in cell wall biosynthesis
MKIYHLSSAPFTGGAARAAFRLHLGLMKEANVESTWLNAGGGATGPNVEILPNSNKRATLTKRLRRRYWAKVVSRDFAPTSPPASNPIGWGSIKMLERLPVPDVWNLHWVSWFLDWDTMLPWMAERAPIVWTLHDLNPLSGIWHYDPLVEERTERRMDLETRAIKLKRCAIAKIPRDRLTFVGPSRWMVERCRKSPITDEFPVKHIPYGLDTEGFAPRDRAALRKMFAIPEDSFVVGFVADNLGDPRKGIDLLLKAIRLLAAEGPRIHLITLGSGNIDTRILNHTHLGPIQNDRLLSFVYTSCDVFVCPSLQDNFPNTVLEAMACGAPVVAYKTGGLIDMIEVDHTGYLALQPGSPDSLYAALKDLLAAIARGLDFRQPSRERATTLYPLAEQAACYMSLYR